VRSGTIPIKRSQLFDLAEEVDVSKKNLKKLVGRKRRAGICVMD
jgi:hypothetical protein